MSRSRSGRIIAATVGYLSFGWALWHFSHADHSADHVLDAIRAVIGVLGLQVGIGKSPVEMLDALSRFAASIRSGRKPTSEHPVAGWSLPTTQTGAAPAGMRVEMKHAEDTPPKRKRPPKGSIAHRSSAKGKAKKTKG